MNWQEVCEHPNLQNLPFKPAKVYHSAFQGEIEYLLFKRDGFCKPVPMVLNTSYVGTF
jgi:hypothetical protein